MLKFETSNNEEYNIEVIRNNAVYIKKIGKHLPKLYY